MNYSYKQFDQDYMQAVNYDSRTYYNPPITIDVDGVKYILSCGTSDHLTTIEDGSYLRIIGENFNLDYMSLTVINTTTKEIDSCYVDNIESEYPGIFKIETDQQLAILSQHLAF